MVRLITWIETIVVLLVVIIVAGIIALSILFPGSLGILASSASAYFSSASSNSTFSSGSMNFSYPSNWVALNPQFLSNSASKLLPMFGNYSINGTPSGIGVLFPASFITSLAGFIPTLISHANGNLSGLQLPSSLGVVIAGGTKISNSSLDLYSLLSKISGNNSIQNIALSNTSGFGISLENSSLGSLHLAFSRIEISQVNGSICFVFGAAVSNKTTASVNNTFDRISNSINCSFSNLGGSLPSSLLNNILPGIK